MIKDGRLYAMSDKDAMKLLTTKCKKCEHLEDDHFLPVNTTKTETNNDYICRYCGCKIK